MSKRGTDYLESDLKRSLDIAGASTLLAMLAVPATIGAGLVVATEGRPALFRHSRIGRDLGSISIVKIRSMIDGAQLQEPDLLSSSDSRVTRVGAVLRKTNVDETPQLLEILRGGMALVGPRPVSSKDFERNLKASPSLYPEWLHAYRSAKPGLLGMGQLVLKASQEHGPEVLVARMEADIKYVTEASFGADLKVIADTVTLLGGKLLGITGEEVQPGAVSSSSAA